MNTTTEPDHRAIAEARTATAEPLPEAGIAATRIARLFRHTVRTGGVNPLLHLMPRFRKSGAR